MRRIMDHLLEHAKKEKQEKANESVCTGFCLHLQFKADAPNSLKNLIITMVMAVLGS
jgi:hypothetical protein